MFHLNCNLGYAQRFIKKHHRHSKPLKRLYVLVLQFVRLRTFGKALWALLPLIDAVALGLNITKWLRSVDYALLMATPKKHRKFFIK